MWALDRALASPHGIAVSVKCPVEKAVKTLTSCARSESRYRLLHILPAPNEPGVVWIVKLPPRKRGRPKKED